MHWLFRDRFRPRPTQRVVPVPVVYAVRNRQRELVRRAAKRQPFRAARKAAVAHQKSRVRRSCHPARSPSRPQPNRRKMPPRGAARISDSQPTCFIVKLVPRQAFLNPKVCLRPRLDAKALQKRRLPREHASAMNQCGRISNCAKRNEYSSASCLIRSLKAVPIPCPELVLVRSKIGLLDLLASSRRATILRE